MIFESHIKKHKGILISYINKEDNIDRLKEITRLRGAKDIKDNIMRIFLDVFNFKIRLEELKKLKEIVTKEEDINKINALIMLLEDKKEDFKINTAISLYQLLEGNGIHKILDNIAIDTKLKLVDYMMNAFNTEESIKSVSVVQSTKDSCASFLQTDALNNLTLEELNQLVEKHKNEGDIWRNRIYSQINQKNQQEADKEYLQYPVEKIKDFILSDNIISKENFYQDICSKFNKLKNEIEDNTNNEKKLFYNYDKPKKEEDCRDVVVQKLEDKYGYDIELNREKLKANNQVDINIKYKANLDYEVQVECKKDKNSSIYTGIKNQLIRKYLPLSVEYGIYLIFYFGYKVKKDKFLKKVKSSVPVEYSEKIKVICMDLTK